MSEIKHNLSLKAIVKYLDYRLKKDEDENIYKLYTGESLTRLARLQTVTVEQISYEKVYQKLWGVEQKEDKRSVSEIIDDTFAKHGIKIKKHNEEADE